MENVIMESQANRNKVLERLKYDPKTQTIDTGIKKKNGEPIRVRFEITNDEVPGIIKYGKGFDIDADSADTVVQINRKVANMKNNSALAIIYHEIGHYVDYLNRNFPGEIDEGSEKLIEKIINYVDTQKDKFENSRDLNNHDNKAKEYIADTYATNKTSNQAHIKGIDKTYNSKRQMLYSDFKEAKKQAEKDFNDDAYDKIVDEIEKVRSKRRSTSSRLKELYDKDEWSETEKNEVKELEIKSQKYRDEYNSLMDKKQKILDVSENGPEKLNDVQRNMKHNKTGKHMRTEIPSSFKESYDCLIMDNDEFFMEASKNPAVKERQRIVNNLRRLGVDRAHEVDNQKLIDKYEKQLYDLDYNYRFKNNNNMSSDEYRKQRRAIINKLNKIPRLREGVDIQITDSYGDKHKTKLTSKDYITNSYDHGTNEINITPKTMNSTGFDATMAHESGHTEQEKRLGYRLIDDRDYNIKDDDEYIVKCAKVFLQKNADKMNYHDTQWDELHADFLACKKIGFGKMIKLIHTFRDDKAVIDKNINECIKANEQVVKAIEEKYLKFYDKTVDKVVTVSPQAAEECAALYDKAYKKIDNYWETLQKRYSSLSDTKYSGILLTKEQKEKISKLMDKIKNKQHELFVIMGELPDTFKHNGITAGKASAYKSDMESQLKLFNESLNNLKNAFTTVEYRIKFLEDMKHIHDGHPGRCSMKYPPMTAEDKKYMQESYDCLIMDNDKFFMEASKNPNIKARKRTVNNLRRIGVDRAHEVDNKKLIDKLERQIADLEKKWKNEEMSFSDYYDAKEPLKKQIRKLEEGIDIEITDSYGKKRNTKLTSNEIDGDSFDVDKDIINITPKTMNSNQFDAAFNHESGHTEQFKRFGGWDTKNLNNYTISDTDDYPIKCAKLFLQKNKDKMNDHDALWTELHADFLSCKKSGFGKMMKVIHSFKKSKEEIDAAIEECIKNNDEYCKELEKKHLTIYEKAGRRVASQEDIDKCLEIYNEAESKFNHYLDILKKRYDTLDKKIHAEGAYWKLGRDYVNKAKDILYKITEKKNALHDKRDKLKWQIEHNGLLAKNAKEYKNSLESHIYWYNKDLNNLKAKFTTYDYRIKFMEDMKHIHEGHPERCSMKYPPMTAEDKKYMQEFTVEEMFISNIITESEYIQLQERIQILTERSE